MGNYFDDLSKDKKRWNEGLNADDNIFQVAGHGLLSGVGRFLDSHRSPDRSIDQAVESYTHGNKWFKNAMETMLPDAYQPVINFIADHNYTPEEYRKILTDDPDWQKNALADYGKGLMEAHQRDYNNLDPKENSKVSWRRVVNGMAQSVPSMVELAIAAKGLKPYVSQGGLTEAAGTKLASQVTRSGVLGNVARTVLQELPEGLALAPLQALPEAEMEGRDAERDYIETAKLKGTYKKGITEKEARDVGSQVSKLNMPLIASTDTLQNILMRGVTGGKLGLPMKAGLATGVGGGINAAQEMGQQVIPKVVNKENWSLGDTDVLEAGLSGALMGGAPTAVYGGLDYMGQKYDERKMGKGFNPVATPSATNGDIENNNFAFADKNRPFSKGQDYNVPTDEDFSVPYLFPNADLNNKSFKGAKDKKGSSFTNNMRNLEGQISYYAPDGTNCMRTIGLALKGTPFEGQINVDQAVNTGDRLGLLRNPENYTPKAGDIAVVNNGNHAVMVTENGGTIQNGASKNGVYESSLSPAEMFGNVKYYIETSKYDSSTPSIDSNYFNADNSIIDSDTNKQQFNNSFELPEQNAQEQNAQEQNIVDAEKEQQVAPTQNAVATIDNKAKMPNVSTPNNIINRNIQAPSAIDLQMADRLSTMATPEVRKAVQNPILRDTALKAMQGDKKAIKVMQALKPEIRAVLGASIANESGISPVTQALNQQILNSEPVRQPQSPQGGNNIPVPENKPATSQFKPTEMKENGKNTVNGQKTAQKTVKMVKKALGDNNLYNKAIRAKLGDLSAQSFMSTLNTSVQQAMQMKANGVADNAILSNLNISDNVQKGDAIDNGIHNKTELQGKTSQTNENTNKDTSLEAEKDKSVNGEKPKSKDKKQISEPTLTTHDYFSGVSDIIHSLREKDISPEKAKQKLEQLKEKAIENNIEKEIIDQEYNDGIRLIDNIARDQEEEAAKKKKEEAKKAEKYDIDGFADNASNIVKERIVTTLNRRFNFNDVDTRHPELSGSMTRKEYCKQALKAGRVPKAKEYTTDSGKKKTEYMLGLPDSNISMPITKIEYDYSNYLMKTNPALYDNADTNTETNKPDTTKAKQNATFSNLDDAKKAFESVAGIKKETAPIENELLSSIDNSDEARAKAKKRLRSVLNNISANPMFNPELHKAALDYGLILLKDGVNNFARFSKQMVADIGEKIKPWVGSIWKSLEHIPTDRPFDADLMSKAVDFTGALYEQGYTSADSIYEYMKKEYGKDTADAFKGVTESAFAGVDEVFNPTLKAEETAETKPEIKEENTVKDEPTVHEVDVMGLLGAIGKMKNGDEVKIKDFFVDKDNSNNEETETTEAPKTPQVAGANIRFEENEKLNGLEIWLSDKVDRDVYDNVNQTLKANGFKQTKGRFRKHWYTTKDNEQAMNYAKSLGYIGENVVESSTDKGGVGNGQQRPTGNVGSTIRSNSNSEIINKDNSEPNTRGTKNEEGIHQNGDRGKEDMGETRRGRSGRPSGDMAGEPTSNVSEIKETKEPNVSSGSSINDSGKPQSEHRESSGKRSDRPANVPSQNTHGSGTDLSGEPRGGNGRIVIEGTNCSILPNGNFHIDKLDDKTALNGGTLKERFSNNIKAMEIIRNYEETNTLPTPEEKAIIASYSGWGGFANALFGGTWENPAVEPSWEKENTALREVLGTKEAWENAKNSADTAYFTPQAVVSNVWNVVEQLGFKGGYVLDPSMGNGIFYSMMPENLQNKSVLTGVEISNGAGTMSKLLFPESSKSHVFIQGYENHSAAENTYDLIVTNVPFAEYPVAERKYNRLFSKAPFIHDFFLVKGISQLKPNGLMAVVTSHGSLDKSNVEVRQWLAQKAELVGAVRLPNDTFKDKGTQVLTDLLVFRKRPEPISLVEASKQPWVTSSGVPIDSETVINKNNYFIEHPEMLAGKEVVTSGQFGKVLGLESQGNINNVLHDIIKEHFPKNILEEDNNVNNVDIEGYTSADTSKRNYTLYFNDKGNLVFRDGMKEVNPEDVVSYRFAKNEKESTTQERKQRVKDLVAIHDKFRELIDAERDNSPNTEKIRKELLKKYNDYVERCGTFVKKNKNNKIVYTRDLNYIAKIGDSSTAVDLSALVTNKLEPAEIMFKRVTKGITRKDNMSVSDALLLQRMDGITSLDIDKIAEDAKTDKETVIKTLTDNNSMFKTPTGEYQPSDIYLSGNIVEKLQEAQAALDSGDKSMQRNIDELTKVKPKLVSSGAITANIGVSWVSEQQYEKFFADLFNVDSPEDIGLKVENNNGKYSVSIQNADILRSATAQEELGSHYVKIDRVFEAALNSKDINVYTPSPIERGKREFNDVETKQLKEKINNLNKKFNDWLFRQNESRKVEMELAYNNSMNAYAPPTYNASFMEFTGLITELNGKPFKPREHQANFVLNALLNERGIAAHDAGTGKTLVIAMLCMELRRTGKAQKPIIFAHNANSSAIASDIKRFYPSSKVLYIPALKTGKENIVRTKRLVAQIVTGDWDAIVLPHSLIDKLAFRKETLLALKQEEIEAIKNNIIAVSQEERAGRGGSNIISSEDFAQIDSYDESKGGAIIKGKKIGRSTRKAIIQYKQLMSKIEKQAERYEAPDTISFEDSGIDSVIVDEVHVFKKSPKYTTRVVKGLDSGTSENGIMLSLLTDYIHSIKQDKGVYTFSGTIITNTIPEIYSQMKYVMPDVLKATGNYNLDDFLHNFTETEKDMEPTASGDFENVERLKKFVNITELRQIALQNMDIITTKKLEGFEDRKTKSGKVLSDENLTKKEKDELENGRTEDSPKGLPYMKIINVTVPATKRTQKILETFRKKAKEIKNAKGEAAQTFAVRSDAIKMQTLVPAAGSSIKNLNPAFRDAPNSKVALLTKNVKEIYDSHELACQAIFIDQGGFSDTKDRTHTIVGKVEGKRGMRAIKKMKYTLKAYNASKDIVDRLVKAGIPEEQITIVDGKVKGEQREEIANMVATGEIRVVIGNKDTLGVGVNMQDNLRAIHHLDGVWMPGDLEQEDRRGRRQGNKWNTVLNYRYIAEGTDSKKWAALFTKQSFINIFMDKDSKLRTLDSDALADGDEGDIVNTVAAAVGDARIIKINKLKNKLEAANNSQLMFESEKANAAFRLKDARENVIPNIEATIKGFAEDKELYEKNKNLPFEAKMRDLSHKGEWVTFKEQQKAQAFADANAWRAVGTEFENDFATYLGFTIGVKKHEDGTGGSTTQFVTKGKGRNYIGAVSFPSVKQLLNGIDKKVAEQESNLKYQKDSLKILEDKAKEVSPWADLARGFQKNVDDLERDLKNNPVPAPEWFTVKTPVNTTVEYNGDTYFVTGHSTADNTYSLLLDDGEGNGNEITVPAKDVQKEGYNVYDAEELARNPKDQVIDETDNATKEELFAIEREIDRAFDEMPDYIRGEEALHRESKEIKGLSALDAEDALRDLSIDIDDERYFSEYQIAYKDVPAVASAYNALKAEIKDALPNTTVKELSNNRLQFKFGNTDLIVDLKDKIIIPANAEQNARQAHNMHKQEAITVEGLARMIGDNKAYIALSKEGREGTAYHEVMHVVRKTALTPKENNALNKHFEPIAKKEHTSLEEVIADAYKDWRLARKKGKGTMFGKLFQKVYDFAKKMQAILTGVENIHNVFNKIETGKALNRNTNNGTSKGGTQYSVAENEEDTRTAEEKGLGALAHISDNNDTWKDKVRNTADKLYKDWVDKDNELNKLNKAIEAKKGSKNSFAENIYQQKRMQHNMSISRATMLLQDRGSDKAVETINKSLKNKKMLYDVTLQDVFDKVKGLDDSYLAEGNFKDSSDALGTYLMANRVVELATIVPKQIRARREQIKAIAESNTLTLNEKVEKGRALNREIASLLALKKYQAPISLKDASDIVKNAPKVLKDGADLYYKFNDNLLSYAEDAGIISEDLHTELNAIYPHYAPMLRDFSDTAATDMFLGAKNGRGIVNVGTFLRRISLEGSVRKIINPLESSIRNTYTIIDRSERNKVAQTFVDLSADNDIGEFAMPVPDFDHADANRSIFTVYQEGKKVAYQTTPEFYGCIAGLNEETSVFPISIFRTIAKCLRTGATISPDFMARNLIRDTIFAGISSQTGFVPVLDSVKGMWELTHDKQLRSEFKSAGVPMTTFVGHDRNGIKQTLDAMVGGDKKYRELGVKGWGKLLLEYAKSASALFEEGTRAGEFKRARDKGLSVEEAGFLAKEITLDFSRSGTKGQYVNSITPFFNAAIQGTDKMARLIKENPTRTAMQLAKYIVIPSVVLWTLNQGEDWYEELPDDIKNNCWVFKIGNTIYKIPKPQEAGVVFGSGVERALEQLTNTDPKAMKKWITAVSDTAIPSLLPTVPSVMLEWITNYSFFTNKPVVGRREQNLPAPNQYNLYTTEIAKFIGKQTNTSPMKIDNAIKGTFGTAGGFVAGLSNNLVKSEYEAPSKRWSELPAIKGFTYTENSRPKSIEEFYNILNEVNAQHNAEGLKGKPSNLVKTMRKTSEQLNKLNLQANGIYVSKDLDADEKRRRIDLIKNKRLSIAKKAVEGYKKYNKE